MCASWISEDISNMCTNTSLGCTYLGKGAAGTGAELEEEFIFWMLLVVGVWVESWARGTFPMRYQIPMLLSSLSNKFRSINKQRELKRSQIM